MTRQFRREKQAKNVHILGKIGQCVSLVFENHCVVHQVKLLSVKYLQMNQSVRAFKSPYLK